MWRTDSGTSETPSPAATKLTSVAVSDTSSATRGRKPCAAHGFLPRVALEVSETATLVSFVAAGLGVSLVPESVRHMTVHGAVYRPLSRDAAAVELALAWRREDASTVLERALGVVRRDLARG